MSGPQMSASSVCPGTSKDKVLPRWHNLVVLVLLAFGLVSVSACRPRARPDVPPGGEHAENTLADSAHVALAAEDPTPSPEPQPIEPTPRDPEPSRGPLAATPDPIRFQFSATDAAPVSAWRPPLYAVPWALTPYDHFFFIRPIAADEVNWPLADYRYGGIFFEGTVHTGIDIPAPDGTPVLAAGPGKVVWAGYGVYSGINDPEDPYGLAVVIRHDFGYAGKVLYTVYGHLSQYDVAAGQRVAMGEMVGLVGQTGFTTGPHLHFEVRVGENRFFTTRNPELWIAPPQGWGVLAGRVLGTRGLPVEGQLVEVRRLDTGQLWRVKSYGGGGAAKSDPYYQENVVLGDLPAGLYEISIRFAGLLFEHKIEIHPGLVNYFTFQGRNGFGEPVPPSDGVEFAPRFP